MTLEPTLTAALPPRISELAERIAARGGRALAVGGWVRDQLLGADPADLDIEVHGLSAAELDDMLAEFGPVHLIGRSFAIRRVRGIAADLSWVEPPAGSAPLQDDDLEAHFAQAARRRDLTINAMGFDPLTGRLFDPASGRADLASRHLRFVDEARFGDDPLRAFRVAQLAARLEMAPDDALIALCARQDLASIAGERLMNEWTSLLMLARRPSVALEWLERMDQ
ncbi:MAG: polynucleotide adenylyltransferase, partial [Deltaproteobacteria bacterium]